MVGIHKVNVGNCTNTCSKMSTITSVTIMLQLYPEISVYCLLYFPSMMISEKSFFFRICGIFIVLLHTIVLHPFSYVLELNHRRSIILPHRHLPCLRIVRKQNTRFLLCVRYALLKFAIDARVRRIIPVYTHTHNKSQ